MQYYNQKIKELLLVFLFVFCLLMPLVSTFNKSATWDEPRHFYTGLRYLLNKPLPPGVISSFSPPLGALNVLPSFILGKILKIDFLKDINYFYDYIFSARLVSAVYSLILAILVFRWASHLYGESAGITALSLYAFSPNIIAHAGLLTTDIALSCFAFGWFYYFYRTCQDYRLKNILLCVLFFSLGLISKFNFLLFILIYFTLGFILYLEKKGKEKKEFLWRFFWVSLISFVFGLIFLNLSYGFKFLNLRFFIPLPHLYLSELKNILIEAGKVGHPSFLMGKYSLYGWRHYYLIAFLIKTPLAIIMFFLFSIYISLKSRQSKTKVKEYFLWIPVLMFFLFVSLQRCQIGLRHILPVYPFIFVFTSKITNSNYVKSKIFRNTFIVLLIWLIISSLAIFPDYLAYFNPLTGGPANGYKYLVDSNLDWGQELGNLKKYMDRNNLTKINLSYFGSLPPEYYGIDYEDIPAFSTKGVFAISATNLQGVYFKNHARFFWLKKYQPKEKIGYSIFIYEIKNNVK